MTVRERSGGLQERIQWPAVVEDVERFRSYPEVLNIAEVVLAHPERQPAILHAGGTVTYGELRRLVRRTASGLRSLGLEAGEPLLILSQNNLPCVLGFLAASYIGAVPTLANSMLRTEEVGYIADNAGARVVLAYEGSLPAARAAAGEGGPLSTVIAIGEDTAGDEIAFWDLAGGEEDPELAAAPTKADEPAFIVYSSGTTGKPKGIVHGHRWIRTMGDPIAARNSYVPGDVILATGEFSFVAVLGSGLLHPLRAGATVALMDGRPRPETVLERIAEHRVSVVYSVPTLYRMLLGLDDLERTHDLSGLRYVSSAGEALTAGVFEQWTRRTGCPIYETYGVSELQMLIANGPDLPAKAGSVGKVLPGIHARIVDDDGREVAPHEEGLLVVDGDDPGLSLGYRGKQRQWEECFRDGWFYTEDLFTYDEDGYLWHVGRVGDMFKSRGYLIGPAEIESALESHPRIAEAGVVGVADEAMGNRIVAYVVPASAVDDEDEFRDEVTGFLKGRLAPYKMPRGIVLRESLPRSVQGKLLRRELA